MDALRYRYGGALAACLWLLCLIGCAPSSPALNAPDANEQTPSPAIAPASSTPELPLTLPPATPSSLLTTTPASVVLQATTTPVPTASTTPTLVPAAPSFTPELTATPTITPTRIYVPLDHQVSADPAVIWGVPQGWWELSEQVAPPAQSLYWRVWANREAGASIFSPSPPNFPDGLTLLTLHVEPEGVSPFPPPDSATQYANWVQGREVYFYERSGPEAAPFTLRLGLAVVRPPQRFDLTLDCLIPEGSEADYAEALCRDTWDYVKFPFGLCPRPLAASSEPESWRSVSDHYYGYSIEVPGHWLARPGPTGDRLMLLSDPEASDLHHACPLPNGAMKIDFSAGTAQDFSNRQEGGGPELEGFSETTVNGYPVWFRQARGGEPSMPDSSPEYMAIQGFVQGPTYWYLLAMGCRPPTGADADGQNAYHAQCEAMFWQILERFQIRE